MPCPTGKRQHATYEDALAHQKQLVWKNHVAGEQERSKGLNVYPCPHKECAAWHVGHTETRTIPLVYHYTIGCYLDSILEENALRPRKSKAISAAINEPNPLLWFSWNPVWEHSVLKDPRPAGRRVPPTGRAITEIAGEGLIRFGAPASVAKLRWNDYLALNHTPLVQRDAMALRGHPPDWLATDQPVSLSECRAFEVWYRGAWVKGASLSDAHFQTYLSGRMATYNRALERISTKVQAALTWDEMNAIVPEDDAERILLDDYRLEMQEDTWKKAHFPELKALVRSLPKRQIRRLLRRRG